MPTPLADVKITLVDSWDDVQDMLAWVGERRDWLGVDLETNGFDPGPRGRVRMAQLGDVDRGWAIPLEGWGLGGVVKKVLEDYRGDMVCHNLIFELSWFVRDGIEVRRDLLHDSMVAAHLDESAYRIGLKSLARRYVDRDAGLMDDTLKAAKKEQGWGWGDIPLDFPVYWKYSALDPVLTCRVMEGKWKRIQQYRRSYDIEIAAIHALAEARVSGMAVDVPHARSESLRLESEMAHWLPQCEVAPASNKKLVEHFLQRGAKLVKRTDTGKSWAVDKEVLADLERQGFPEARPILEWRKRDKLKSGYFDNLIELQTDGRVHPDIRVLGAGKTGRMSISAPALQTLPKSRVGRSAFVADEGHTLIMADFDGMEMRMVAHLSRDEQLIENYAKGLDQHAWLAEQVYGECTPARRIVAKTAGFAKIYGAGIETFALSAGIGESEAAGFISTYDALFPGVKAHMREASELVLERAGNRKWGWVNTWTGRKLMVEADKPYKSLNYEDQGGCAELTKLKIAECANAGLGPYIKLPVHDEIIFQAPDDLVPDICDVVSRTMSESELFVLDFPVEVKTAKRWGDVYE